eukprot:TRINITY_DN1903_c0_g1_i1.p1 TRINITY_DN1903_c0_g1~~TRINITY_DN1903_c0_g1_i1.p1  ORF type:complete len:381 (+),score=156.10 TRINITY_DN1903_c0_g1_i1:15-1157(+)
MAMRLNTEYLSRILSTPTATAASTAVGGSAGLKARTPRAMGLTPRGPSVHTATTPRAGSPAAGGSGSGVLLISNAHERKQLSYFHLLYTEMGFKNCQKFFYDHSIVVGQRTERLTFDREAAKAVSAKRTSKPNTPTSPSRTSPKSPHTPSPKGSAKGEAGEGEDKKAEEERAGDEERERERDKAEKVKEKACALSFALLSSSSSLDTRAVSESQFISFMRELVPDMGDHQIVVAFDVFDKEDCGGIFFDEWFLLLALYCAIESGETLQFLYRHSEHMFRALLDDPTADKMIWGEFTRLAYLMGIHERELFECLEPFKVDIFDPISYDDFVIFYFEVLSSTELIRSDHNESSASALRTSSHPHSAHSKDVDPKKQGECSLQ